LLEGLDLGLIAPPALSEAAAADFTFDFTAAESVARNGAGVWADTFSDNPVDGDDFRPFCLPGSSADF